MLQDLNRYFDTEITQLFITLGISIAAVIASILMIKRGREFIKAMGWSILVGSSFLAVASAIYFVDVSATRKQYSMLLFLDPPVYKVKATAHTEKMQNTFQTIFFANGILTALGLCMVCVGFSQKNEKLKGAGAGVTLLAFSLTALEMPNQQRALEYKHAVEAFQPTP